MYACGENVWGALKRQPYNILDSTTFYVTVRLWRPQRDLNPRSQGDNWTLAPILESSLLLDLTPEEPNIGCDIIIRHERTAKSVSSGIRERYRQ
jgi:hypothetical protein